MSAKPRGLGRGLDALLPKVEHGSQRLRRSELRPSSLQPRKVFDEEALAELAASIQAKGVLQPLLVRPVADHYEIVAGERRFQASGRAGLEWVPVIIREMSDQEALEIAIIENLQRENLNALEEAEAFDQLVGFGLTQDEVAEALGKSRSAISNSLRLLTLPEPARQALATGRITAGHGRAILAREAHEREWALQQILDKGLNVRQAESLRRVIPRSQRVEAPGPRREVEEELTRLVGSRVQLRGNRKGKIELHFNDEEELHRLLELLGYQP